MEHVEYAYTRGMDESEVEERLRTTETGVLALSDGGESYAIPLDHYYEDGNLYFRLGITEGSEKRDFIEATERSSYVLYGAEATEDPRELDSWSIVIEGTLRKLTDEQRQYFDTAEINRDFAPIRVFDEDIEEIDIELFELEIDRMTGRITLTQ